MRFEIFLERYFRGLNYLSIPTETHVPGVILNNDDRVEMSLAKLFYDENPVRWDTKIVAADLNNETVSGSRGLGLDFTLLGMISAKGTAKAEYVVTFEFNDVSAIVFDTDGGAVFENEVRTLIMELKNRDRAKWKQILHEFVVMEAVVVRRATITIHRNGAVVTEANFPTTAGEISIKGSYQWGIDGRLIIENTGNIPFGVLGFQVKRQM